MKILVFLFLIGFLDCFVFYQNSDFSEAVLSSNFPDVIQPRIRGVQSVNVTFCPRDVAIIDSHLLTNVNDSVVYRIDATSCQKSIFGWQAPYPITGYLIKVYRGELSSGSLLSGTINGNLSSTLITVQITMTSSPNTTFPAIFITTDPNTTTIYPNISRACYSGSPTSFPLSLNNLPNPSIVVYRGEIDVSDATPGLWGLRIDTSNLNFKGKIYRGISLDTPDLIYGGKATCSLNPPMNTIPELIFDEFITLQLDGQPSAQLMSYYCAKQAQFNTAYTIDTNPKTLMMPSFIDGSSNADYAFTIKDMATLPDQALQIDVYNEIPTQANLSILFYNYAQEKNVMMSFTNSSRLCQVELPTSNMTISYKRQACQSDCAPALLLRLQQVPATLNIKSENITFCPRDFAILDNSKLIHMLDSIVYRIDATSCQKNIYGWLPPYPITGYSFKFYQGELSTGKLIAGPINGNLNSSLITVQITKTTDSTTTFPAILLTTDFTTTTVYPPKAGLCYSGGSMSVPLSLPGVPNPVIVVYRGEINLSEATPGLWGFEIDLSVNIQGNVYRGISLFAPDLIYGGNSTCSSNPPMSTLPLQVFDDYMTIQLTGNPSNQSMNFRCTQKTQFNTKSYFDEKPEMLMMPSFIDGSTNSSYNFSIATKTASISQVVQIGFYNQIPAQGRLSIAYIDAASQNMTTLSYTNSSNVCQLELPTANLTISYQWPACQSNCASPLLIRFQQVLPIATTPTPTPTPIATTSKGAPSMGNGASILLLFLFCLPLFK
ncbi:unnamed protein product, partial [Mesorhabditis belari]|uniref:Uncharacterized protein n=1 Tax=Mesorhabditis belari TaxID=2138241 RepID=A0AAF3FBX2_9BILA